MLLGMTRQLTQFTSKFTTLVLVMSRLLLKYRERDLYTHADHCVTTTGSTGSLLMVCGANRPPFSQSGQETIVMAVLWADEPQYENRRCCHQGDQQVQRLKTQQEEGKMVGTGTEERNTHQK